MSVRRIKDGFKLLGLLNEEARQRFRRLEQFHKQPLGFERTILNGLDKPAPMTFVCYNFVGLVVGACIYIR